MTPVTQPAGGRSHKTSGLAPDADRQLVDAVLTGNVEAFRVLLDRESGSVIATCRRILGDPDEAQDIAQDAFLHAYRRLATFRGDGPFGAWVTRIAARLAVRRLADRRELQEAAPGAVVATASARDHPEARALEAEQRRAIVAAIATLPPTQRQVIALRFYRDLTLEEIAAATSAPLGTVKSRLHRATASLREQFAARPSP